MAVVERVRKFLWAEKLEAEVKMCGESEARPQREDGIYRDPGKVPGLAALP